jgi:phage-related baseplate assembly protein
MARFNLPEIEFVSSSPDEIESRIVARFEELRGVSLTQADPRRKFIQAIVEGFAVQRNLIDYSAKQNLLAYAEDDYLEHMGANRNTPRGEPKKAETTMEINLISSSEDLLMPAGTQFHAVDEIYFESQLDKIVSPGTTRIEVPVICTTAGEIGNGFLPGQIKTIVEPMPWVQSVRNLTTSEGGVDWEEDEAYADRIRQAPEGFSVAGPEGAYKYWAKTASQLIIDVDVSSPSDGVVVIRPLLKDGGIPGGEILESVSSVLNDKKIRPLTDHVQVLAPETISYNLSLTYWVEEAQSSILGSIQSNVETAVQNYINWQKSKLGRDIDPSELIMQVKMAGAKRVELLAPSYAKLEGSQVALANQMTINFGGLESE